MARGAVWAAVVLCVVCEAEVGDFGNVPCPLASRRCLTDTPSYSAEPLPLNQTLDYARMLLQQAIVVEHSTIPLYLTSLYSIRNQSSPTARLIRSV